MNIVDEQKKAYDFVDKIINNKKISHAYFIETNNYDNYLYFVKYFIKKILCLNIENDSLIRKIEIEIDNNNYPDIKYIEPDGFWIKKEQLISLEKDFSKKSMLDNKLIYVINGAERLNDSSANTILKFLEEPNDNIIAILIANNRYKVIDTIISRCQIISLKENQSITLENNYIKDFYNDIIEKKQLIIKYDDYLQNIFNDRNMAKKTIEELENKMVCILNSKNSKIDDKLIIKYVLILTEYKNKLEFNVNMKLWLNDFIVKLMEVI